MNKVVLVGNGFDIHHGLKTKYSDFMGYLKEVLMGLHEPIEWNLKRKAFLRYPEDIFLLREDETEDPYISVFEQKKHSFYNPEDAYTFVVNRYARDKSVFYKALFSEHEKLNQWSDFEQLYFSLRCAGAVLLRNRKK